MSKKKIILIAVLLAIAAGAIYAYREYYRTNVNLDTVQADYTLQATDLANEFVANDSVADSKYRNKILAVQGVVKAVDKSEGDCTIVLGDTTDMAPSVRCILDSTHTALGAAFKRGDKVVVKGAITGFKKDETGLLGSDVELNRCVVDKDKN